MPHLEVNGLNFHVQRMGDTGSPVVMVHGLLVGTLAAWYFTAAPALASSHRVFLYDLRGHGRSNRPARGYDVASMTDDLVALIDAEFPNDEPISLVGHSYGALIALRYALDHPGRVTRLVVVEAPLPPSRFEEFETFFAQSPAEMIRELPLRVGDLLMRGKRQARKFAAGLLELTVDTSILSDLRAESDIPDEVLSTLDCDLLCIYGSSSKCRDVGERLVSVVPNAALEILEGGHYLHIDAGPALTKSIVEFLSVAPAASGTSES